MVLQNESLGVDVVLHELKQRHVEAFAVLIKPAAELPLAKYRGEIVRAAVSSGWIKTPEMRIADVGEMFNRKADYSNIIDWTGEGFQLRISASNKGTNWIVIFSRPADMWAAGTLLDAADEIPARALDTSGKATAGEIAAAVAASIAMQNEKFAEAKEIAERDVAAIQTHIELLRKQYPSWVK